MFGNPALRVQMGDETFGKKIRSELSPDDKASISQAKAVVNKNQRYKCTVWLYRLARLTDKAQYRLEAAIDKIQDYAKIPTLTNEDFCSWARAHRNQKDKRGKELVEDHLLNLLYTTWCACLVLDNALDWGNEQIATLEDRIDRARYADKENVAEELEEIKGSIEEILEPIEDNENEGHDPMIEALTSGDLDAVLVVLDNGFFQLDIGEPPL